MSCSVVWRQIIVKRINDLIYGCNEEKNPNCQIFNINIRFCVISVFLHKLTSIFTTCSVVRLHIFVKRYNRPHKRILLRDITEIQIFTIFWRNKLRFGRFSLNSTKIMSIYDIITSWRRLFETNPISRSETNPIYLLCSWF